MEFDPGAVTPPARDRARRRRLTLVATAVTLIAGAGVFAWLRTDAGAAHAPAWLAWAADTRPEGATPIRRIVPESVRIKVEVLNATDTRGLARVATFALRDAGFDVVYFGNTTERTDTTVVRDRSGHADWARLAVDAMSPARSEVRPDSGRLIDLTVLVGRSWRPPAQPLRP